ncbi:MAG: PAS domain-containing protein, partial [Parvibaculum sedimenti]
MTETSAEMAELERNASGREPGSRLSPRQIFTLAGVAVAGLAILLDILGFHAFAVPGVLTVIGTIGAAGIILFGFSSTISRDVSRAPAAAGDALNALPDPCYATDRRGAVLFANEAYRSLVG